MRNTTAGTALGHSNGNSMTPSVEYHGRFQADARTPAAARRLVRCLDAILERATVDDLELMVTELVTNSVRHAGLGQHSWVQLELNVVPDLVRVEVIDPGRGFDPADRPTGTDIRGSGWGLYLVEQLADRWGVVHDAFTRVWFELRLTPRPALV